MKKIFQNNWFIVIAGIMLILAILPIWPYGYFQFLRWVVSIASVYSAYVAYESKNKTWVFIMGAITILFNPISPIYLQKETWVILDLIASILMFISINKIKKQSHW